MIRRFNLIGQFKNMLYLCTLTGISSNNSWNFSHSTLTALAVRSNFRFRSSKVTSVFLRIFTDYSIYALHLSFSDMPFPNYISLLKGMATTAKESAESLQSHIMCNPLPPFHYPKGKANAKLDCDIMSTCMMPADMPQNLVAAYTIGDGNCLYNSLSMHLMGDCSRSTELRCRVAYELVLQNDLYMDISKSCLYYDQPSIEYISSVATLGTFSGILEVMAAANVMGLDIVCHYPDVNQRIRPYFNTTFKAEFRRPYKPPIHLMFTRAGSMRDSRVSYWNPNHFTIIVPRNAVKGNT